MARPIPPVALLLLASIATGASPAAAQGSEWRIEDPAGDAYVFTPGASTPVATQATNHLDIRSITLHSEDESSLQLTIQVESMRHQPGNDPGGSFSLNCGSGEYGSGGSSASYTQFAIDFSLAGTPFRYMAFVRVLGEPLSQTGFEARSALGLLCIYSQPAQGSIFQYLPTRLEANKIHVSLSKSALMGLLPSPDFPRSSSRAPKPPALKQGDVFTEFSARSWGSADTVICCLFNANFIQDIAPNTGKGPTYTLQHRTANSLIRLGQPTPTDVLTLAPGNQSVPLLLTNLAGGKRLVRLTYDAQGPDATRILVTGPTAVTIAAGETKNFSAAVEISGTQELDPANQIKIRGESTGYPDEVAQARLTPAMGDALGPKMNFVYLHASKEMEGLEMGPDACHIFIVGACRRAILSTLETDPTAAAPDEFTLRTSPSLNGGGRAYHYGIVSRVPSALPYLFASDRPILLTLKTATAQPFDADVRAYLAHSPSGGRYVSDEVLFAEGRVSASTGNPIQVPLTVNTGEPVLVPRGHFLRLRIEFTVPAGTGAAVLPTTGVKVIGGQSRLELPLVSLDEAGLEASVRGPFQLRALDGGQEFINPGEARLLNVSLLNQAPDNRSARLSVQSSLPGWRAEVLPGTLFRLEAGDSILLGIRAYAPATTAEGERVVVTLNATDDAGQVSTLRLVVIATNGVDLPDEQGPYEADADAKQRLHPERVEGSPGPGAAALLTVCVVWICLIRRRET